jgi:hypothetical protein
MSSPTIPDITPLVNSIVGVIVNALTAFVNSLGSAVPVLVGIAVAGAIISAVMGLASAADPRRLFGAFMGFIRGIKF